MTVTVRAMDAADAEQAGSCCGAAAKQDAVAAGQGCCA